MNGTGLKRAEYVVKEGRHASGSVIMPGVKSWHL